MAEVRAIEVAVKPHLDAVVVRPGDRLVIRMARSITPADCDNVVDRLKGLLPGVTPVLVFGDQILVYRDGGPDD